MAFIHWLFQKNVILQAPTAVEYSLSLALLLRKPSKATMNRRQLHKTEKKPPFDCRLPKLLVELRGTFFKPNEVLSHSTRLLGFRTCQDACNALPYHGRERAAHHVVEGSWKGRWSCGDSEPGQAEVAQTGDYLGP